MKHFNTSINSEILTQICQGELKGKIQADLCKVGEPQEADEKTIIFLEQEKLLEKVKASSAGLIITTAKFVSELPERVLLIVQKPYFSLMRLITWWLEQDNKDFVYTIQPTAIVAEDVRYEGEVAIGANVVIGSGCILGKGVIISEGCSLGKNVSVGSGTRIYPNVCIYDDCVIGRNCILHSGVVVGADGFAFSSISELTEIINSTYKKDFSSKIENNIHKIQTIYSWKIIIENYENYFKEVLNTANNL
ncbi:MAG TPA: LpxD N-terminal domain-containing protein [Candidatus Cloacimonas sp.]|nr:LpxD N-terminal domain-containing protein [Candidatus Cloacimonas sp.]